ncbi:MAG TPA: site-specific DNA-methyltransferase [Marinobacter sp.]|uniref:DNA methylase N-4/N-6 domain-containing protein n=1 Tax=marine sediment metagenome TaxID=412755 RepID=A0A0F9LQ08_9ZZZZ|nr:site-specific DNA-methyltransferase [Marinobacter sp.]
MTDIAHLIDTVICGDCLEVYPTLPKAKMVFADPPDNLGMKYDGYRDKIPDWKYDVFLSKVIHMVLEGKDTTDENTPDIFWLSFYHHYLPCVHEWTGGERDWKQFIWYFTFGQHRHSDCGNNYRPIMRWMKKGAVIYPDAIRVPSARQLQYNDKRADPRGRVPGDVWEFPRVCGTFHERRKWHPTQHPEALMERIIKMSCVPGDLVIDLFAGTGTTLRVCKRLGIDCIGIEMSKAYCERIDQDTAKGGD